MTSLPATQACRRGLTLLELLVVLVLMALASAVVSPMLLRRAAAPTQRMDALVTAARRTAISRGEPVRLQLAEDGAWAVVSQRAGAPISAGRIDTARVGRDSSAITRLDLNIDAMGSCMPAGAGSTTAGGNGGVAIAFDPLLCRPRPSRTP